MAEQRMWTPSRERARRPRRRAHAVLGALAVLLVGLPSVAVAHEPADLAAASAEEGGLLAGRAAAAVGETVIGWVSDFGFDHPDMQYLRNQVDAWDVDYVVSTGDNWQYSSWPGGHGPEPTGTNRYDRVVGSVFCPYMRAAHGPLCPSGEQAGINRFFPVAGNHDHDDGPLANYLAYFDLPGEGTTSTHPSGNDLYYDVVLGDVHLFVIDSESVSVEAEGGDPALPTWVQQNWLEDALATSAAPWKVVALHEPVYGSSVRYGSNPALQEFDFAGWGADVVINGHASLYERVHRDGIRYVTAGIGGGIGDDGSVLSGTCRSERVEGSQVCIGRGDRPYLGTGSEVMGSVRIVATPTELQFEARTVPEDGDHLLDSFELTKPAPTVTTTSLPAAQVGSTYSQQLSATGGSGPPYTWASASGTLPPGLSLSTGGTISGQPTSDGTYTFSVRATAGGVQSAPRSLTITVDAAPPAPDGGAFVGMEPTRVLDTRRAGQGPCVSGSREVTVAGRGEVPVDAAAVALNVTVVEPSAPGYATVHPTGGPRPTASNLNYRRGQVVPNLVTTKVGAGGKVTVFSSGGCPDVVVDVAGYYTSGETGPGGFTGITPRRALDTRRAGQGPCVSGNREVTVAGRGEVPVDAAAVALNVTVVEPSAPGYATVHASGEPRPTASNLNYVRGQIVPNHVTSKIGDGGKVTVFTSGGCPDVVVDVAGYYEAGEPSSGGFTGITPRRVLDTRTGGPCVSGAGRVATVAPHGDSIPVDADAVALNVTVVEPSAPGYATVYPEGTARPTASNVNYRAGQVVPNAALVKVGDDGRLRVYASGGCPHVVVDVVGYHEG